jgi:cyclophilin family peptidyl-prolyl cis-trans isomerase
LKEFCEKTQDSLKTITLRAIAILANRKSNSERMSGFVSPFLRSESEDVRSAAAYYFSRNISRFHIRDLIIAHFTKDRIGNKYRYKALDQIAKKYKKLPIDSTLLDTLRNDLERQLADNNIPWYTKFYQISLMALFNDSLAVKKVACFLTDSIPHLRTKAIEVLGSWHTPSVRGILIGHYSNALWLEKGYIIKSLADIDRRFTYRLIQQNLDQGTLCFKELLLESLAKINSSSAAVLLHQFLQIPNKRLKLCAFKQLADVHRVKRQDALLMINSGDPALTTVAAEWLYKNPGVVSIEQIEKSYNELKEPDGIEAMLSLMRLAGLKQEQTSIPFYLKALNETKSYILFQQISRNLKDLNIALADSLAPRVSLFVPPEAKDLGKSISVIMKTNKGEIIMDLWPQIAPFTVANFVHLAENGFYEGLAFHRVVADFVIQGGDPRGDGWGGPGYYIPCEYNYRPYVSGSVGIATSGKDTGGSQFFICHTEQPHLNGRYSNFGQVKDGMDVVNRIQRGDKIIEIIINKGV